MFHSSDVIWSTRVIQSVLKILKGLNFLFQLRRHFHSYNFLYTFKSNSRAIKIQQETFHSSLYFSHCSNILEIIFLFLVVVEDLQFVIALLKFQHKWRISQGRLWGSNQSKKRELVGSIFNQLARKSRILKRGRLDQSVWYTLWVGF